MRKNAAVQQSEIPQSETPDLDREIGGLSLTCLSRLTGAVTTKSRPGMRLVSSALRLQQARR
jgi:hypothetical protein